MSVTHLNDIASIISYIEKHQLFFNFKPSAIYLSEETFNAVYNQLYAMLFGDPSNLYIPNSMRILDVEIIKES